MDHHPVAVPPPSPDPLPHESSLTQTTGVASRLQLLEGAAASSLADKFTLATSCLGGLILTVDRLGDDCVNAQTALAEMSVDTSPTQARLAVRLAYVASTLFLAIPSDVSSSSWQTAMQQFLDEDDIPAGAELSFLTSAFDVMSRLAYQASLGDLVAHSQFLATDGYPSTGEVEIPSL